MRDVCHRSPLCQPGCVINLHQPVSQCTCVEALAPDCPWHWLPHAIQPTSEARMLCSMADAVGQLFHERYVAFNEAKNWPDLDGFRLAMHDQVSLDGPCVRLAYTVHMVLK